MRQAKEVELALPPRPAGATLQRWLYESIRDAILDRRLAPGSRLPATRELGVQHGLSRGTVLAVFDQLAAEGYLVGRTGCGSFVAPDLPEGEVAPFPPEVPAARRVPAARLSERGRLLARSYFPILGDGQVAAAFRASQPDLAAFPFELWTRISARRSRLADRSVLAAGDALGHRPLREAIAEHLRSARGLACTADRIAIVGSVQQAVDLCARLLLDPGDQAWLEDPGYAGARLVFEAAGAAIIPVPVDAKGLNVDLGRLRAPMARLAYVTAGRQAPLGMPLALDRRLALLAWADAADATVIEDDYDSEYRFTGSPLAALKSLDASDRVVYAGTFTKFLFPSLRLAYAVLPERLVEPFAAALAVTSRHAPVLPQAVLSDFMAEGHFGRHVRRMRLLYADRAEAFSRSMERHLAGLLEIPPITGGLDTPALLAGDLDDAEVTRLAAEAGVETRAFSTYTLSRRPPSGLVLGFAAVDAKAIEAGARTLARVIRSTVNNRAGFR
jgi:GntR family transcriptional regulator/MocR family aminotransferase